MTQVTVTYEDSIQHPPVYQDKDVEVFIEDSTIGWVVHCYVHNWSKSIYIKLVDLLLDIREHAPRNEVYVFSFNDKLTKFATMFGFESIDTITDTSTGKEGELMALCAMQ